MLVVHHIGTGQSERLTWLCEELDIKYDLKIHYRAPVLSGPDIDALHPLGALPVIEDGDIKIAESAACAEYIINIYGNGRLIVKPGAKNYPDYLYWYHFANGTLQPAVSRTMYLKFAGVSPENPSFKGYIARLDRILSFLDDRLSRVQYLAGDEFSLADIMPIFTLTTMRQFNPIDLSKYQHILAYVKRMTDRPAYRKSMAKSDPNINIESQINGPPPPVFPALAARM